MKQTLFSSKNHNWETPKDLFNQLKQEFNILVDACTSEDNPLNTDLFYTEKEDGLKQDWITWTFCNPPYNQSRLWVEKAMYERKIRDVKSILLLPARTDTKLFHDYIYNKPNIEIRFLKGRVKFIDKHNLIRKGHSNSAPFPSMLVVFY